jgi:hexosaminidase
MQACQQAPNQVSIIPKPNKMKIKSGNFEINQHTKLYADNDVQMSAMSKLNGYILKNTNYLLETKKAGENSIAFIENKNLKDEEYKLNITNNKIKIEASSYGGYFYGVQSLVQLFPPNRAVNSKDKFSLTIPNLSIKDSPRFKYRAMHLDVSRHFFSVKEVKTYLDYLAMYKINKFHWHLTDDQGWRIEIKKYPLLTEKGAWREYNKHDSTCLERLDKDPTYEIDKTKHKVIGGKKIYGGFYTQDQIKEIIKYASNLNIEIIPEIDVPGHFDAAISNYSYLRCPIDNSEKSWNSYPACLGKKTTYTFIKDVLNEVADLFPSKYLHIGGDEVRKAAWEQCKLCQRAIKKNKLKDEHELQSHFNIEIEKFLKSKGKTLVGWDEIVEGGASSDAVITWWRNWASSMREKAVDNGSDLIITPAFQYYFDAGYGGDSDKKVYKYDPIPGYFTPEQAKKIIGIQANLWTEYVPNFKRAQFQLFPRITAFAESAWTDQKNKNWEDYEARMFNELKKYDALDILYHIPKPSGIEDKMAFVGNTKVEIKSPVEGVEIFYTIDESEPNNTSTKYSGAISISEKTILKVRIRKDNRWSEVFTSEISKQEYGQAIELKNPKQGIKRFYKAGDFPNSKDIKVTKDFTEKVVANIDLLEYRYTHVFGLVFEGYIKIEKDGIYQFITSSDDGDVILIDDKLVVDNGGSHGERERANYIALKAGFHKITHKYNDRGGDQTFNVWIKAPGEKRRKIKDKELFY